MLQTQGVLTFHLFMQVAQGVVDHTYSVLGSPQHEHRRSLEDLLLLYSISTTSMELDQGASACLVYVAELVAVRCCAVMCRAVLCCAVPHMESHRAEKLSDSMTPAYRKPSSLCLSAPQLTETQYTAQQGTAQLTRACM